MGKVQEEFSHVNHTGIFVHNNKSAAAHHCTCCDKRIIIYRQVKHGFRQTAAGGAADLNSFEFLAIGNTAANIINNFTHGNTHRHLCQTSIVNFACQSENLGALGFFCTKLAVPVSTVNNNLCYVSKGFNIIDIGWLAPQTGYSRERRTRTRHTTFAFNRSHQRSFFAADESTGAFLDVDSKAEFSTKNILT
ncbi:hypothetical protein EVA_12173 [gut metagenome]|uniref:Uncharacterized protein n=1 Tax=gut metagenome TaxID=749906 RepID=J9CI41_9ZZZZ